MNQNSIDFFQEKACECSGAAMFVQDSMWVKWEWVNIPADRLQLHAL